MVLSPPRVRAVLLSQTTGPAPHSLIAGVGLFTPPRADAPRCGAVGTPIPRATASNSRGDVSPAASGIPSASEVAGRRSRRPGRSDGGAGSARVRGSWAGVPASRRLAGAAARVAGRNAYIVSWWRDRRAECGSRAREVPHRVRGRFVCLPCDALPAKPWLWPPTRSGARRAQPDRVPGCGTCATQDSGRACRAVRGSHPRCGPVEHWTEFQIPVFIGRKACSTAASSLGR